MKTLASIVCAFSFFGVALVGEAKGFESLDFSKAFPEEKLFNQMDMGEMQTYIYLTNSSYSDLKKRFVKFIGDGWKEENSAEYKRMLKKQGAQTKLEGITVFMHPDTPKKRLGLSLAKVKMAGKSGMASVMVMEAEE